MAAQQGPRERLAAERAGTLARLAGLEREFAAIVESSQAASVDDEHDPEGATIAFERQHAAALIDQARRQLARIEAALARVAAGRYGSCEECGRPIGAGRLAARPTATRCIACASAGRGRRPGQAGQAGQGRA